MASRYRDLYQTPIYRSWVDMKTRCTNDNRPDWPRYGGRGISYTPRWERFDDFADDMVAGYFKGATLDRIDNDGNYEPSNCRWITRAEQNRNQRSNRLLTYGGITQTVTDWSEQLGIKNTTIRQRLDAYGWSVEKALTTKVGI